MTEPAEYDQFRGVRRLFRWVAILTVLGVGLVVFAAVYLLGSGNSGEQAEESARKNVEALVPALDISMSDKELVAAVEAHRGFYPHIVRKPGSTTIFAEFEGYASGIPYGGRSLVCFRLVIFAKPHVTVVEPQEMCPPAAPSPTPPSPS